MAWKREVHLSCSGQGKSEGSCKHDKECFVSYNGGDFLTTRKPYSFWRRILFRETSKLPSLYMWSIYRCLFFCIPKALGSQIMFRIGDVKLYISYVLKTLSSSSCSIHYARYLSKEERGGAVSWGTAFQAVKSRVRFPIESFEFEVKIIRVHPVVYVNKYNKNTV
jgi:hypothetical protein